MSEQDEVEEQVAVEQEDTLAALTSGNFTPTGMPPGNPKYVSEGEADLRKAEIAKLGQAEACRRAWARATESKARRAGGNPNPRPKGRADAPRKPVQFSDVSPGPKSQPKGRDKEEVKKWAASVQLGHAMLAFKLQRADFALSDDEAELLTKGVLDVLEYYNIKLKGQAGAWAGLVYAVGMVYGPRIATLVMERIQANRAAPAPQPNPNWAGNLG